MRCFLLIYFYFLGCQNNLNCNEVSHQSVHQFLKWKSCLVLNTSATKLNHFYMPLSMALVPTHQPNHSKGFFLGTFRTNLW